MARLLVPEQRFIPYAERFNGTTSIVNLGPVYKYFTTNEFTVLTYTNCRSGGEGGLGYITAIANGAGIGGRRINWTTTSALIIVAASDSTGTDQAPSAQFSLPGGDNGPYKTTPPNWNHWAFTFPDSLTGSNIKGYVSQFQSPMIEMSISTSSNGTGSLTRFTSTCDLTIGNRDDEARTWDGEIAYIAEWDRVLSYTELLHAQQHGPLTVPDGMIYCWSGGRDWGPHKFKPVIYKDIKIGDEPPNRRLG